MVGVRAMYVPCAIANRADAVCPVFTHTHSNSHGTKIAGVIGARPNNGIGLAGVAPNLRQMVLKVRCAWMHGWGLLTPDSVARDEQADWPLKVCRGSASKIH